MQMLLKLLGFILPRPMVLVSLLLISLLSGGVLYGLNAIKMIDAYKLPFIGIFFSSGPIETISIAIQPPSAIDKLFTGFVMMQLIDVKYKDQLKENPSGYCYYAYEVGIGYQNLTQQLLEEHIKTACTLNDQNLPPPQILSVNSTTSEVSGDYNANECESWNADLNIRERKIEYKLTQQERLTKIRQTGQNILGSYLRVYCTVPPVEVRL